MSIDNPFVPQILASKEFFERSTRVLEEADSAFSPTPDTMTVAEQVAHTAHTIDWFIQGVTRPEGFDLDFAKQAELINSVKSLAQAREMLAAAYDHAVAFVQEKGLEGLMQPIPPGPIMGGAPLSSVIGAMIEHTAHHRGALTVYSRLLGKVPPMPYGG